jgi:hypothetical protein
MLLVVGLMAAGCAPRSTYAPPPAVQASYLLRDFDDETGLTSPVVWASVDAVVVPPLGWEAEPLKASKDHAHQVWLSPSGHTAYGVIQFDMPWSVGNDWALWGFLREMRKTEGEARLITKLRDPDLPGIRFEAEGGQYRLRTNLLTRGRRGWAVYAGTRRDHDVVPDELDLAERAREQTVVDLPDELLAAHRENDEPTIAVP